MFKNLLVPLDGSQLAESVIPVAVSLALKLSSHVTLLHIIEQDAPSEVHNDRHLTSVEEAQAYLDQIQNASFKPLSIPVDIHVHEDPEANVSRSIIEHASDEFKPDLIILCSHGKSGIRNLLFGNIAQQVLAASGIPVLVIKPGDSPTRFDLQQILLPLDNESNHEQALPYAEALSRAYHAHLTLLCVVPTLGTDSGPHAAAGALLPGTASAYLEMAEEIANEHFDRHVKDLHSSGIEASSQVSRGDPAATITEQAITLHSDLIIFGTHGHAGLGAFWKRSVAATVAAKTQIPLLLIPL